MSYATEAAKIDRTPCRMVELDIDQCQNTYGVSPCTATGSPGEECYNTYPTCQDRPNFTLGSHTLQFTSFDTALPFAGPRPYLSDVSYTPTEIKDEITVSARTKLRLVDEPDTDIGIDPYVSTRASVQGTYWKKFLARNKNYYGRRSRVYDGFVGIDEGDFELRFSGTIDSIKIERGMVTVEVVDLLRSLADVETPEKVSIELNADIDDTTTSITLDGSDDLDASGYIRIDDEVIGYTSIGAGNVLGGVTRAEAGTTSSEHDAGDKVEKVRRIGPENPFDILQGFLSEAGVDSSDINTTSWDYWKVYPGGEPDYAAWITEPITLKDLFWEIVRLIDCQVWYSEGQKIDIRRNFPNEVGRSESIITDAANIVDNSTNVDLNPSSRISLVVLRWDKDAIGEDDKVSSYGQTTVSVDSEAESANEYGKSAVEELRTRFVEFGFIGDEKLKQYVSSITNRRLWRRRDPLPIINLAVELKDAGIKTGDHVLLSTDELTDSDGNDLSNTVFQVLKRDDRGEQVMLRLRQVSTRKICIIATDGTADFDSATYEEKQQGFVSGDDGRMADFSDGYYIY